MRTIITLVLAIITASAANAQYKIQTLDIRTNKSFWYFTNNNYTRLNGKMLFMSHDQTNNCGMHTWISDGTAAGTQRIIFPGCNFTAVNYAKPFPVIKNGTTELAFFGYNQHNVAPFNFFPYATDGTLAGTIRLAALSYNPRGLDVALKNKFYFTGTDTFKDAELWVSDGTPAGTQQLVDIYPGKTSSAPSIFAADTNRFFFSANSPGFGTELWCSNGTAAGTYMVKDITPGTGSTTLGMTATSSIIYNGILFFWVRTMTYGYELWRSDGSATGTYMIKDIKPGSNGSWGQSNFAIANNLVFFAADDSIHGNELWVTDGSPTGTRMVKDINTSTKPTYLDADPNNFYTYKGEVYFSANDSLHGVELWKTNGEASGTKLVKDICTQGSSYPKNFYAYKKHLFFTAVNNCEGNPSPPPYDLHYTDGTAAGTVMIRPSGATVNNGATRITEYIEYDGKLFFEGVYHGGREDMWYVGDSLLISTGINNIETEIVTLYPNPAHHNFTIKTTTSFKTGSITLTDVTGRFVKTEKLYNNEQTISLQGIAPGMYMADVWLDDKRTTQKLIIE